MEAVSDELRRRRRKQRIRDTVEFLLRAALPAAVLVLAVVAYNQNQTIDALEHGSECRSRVNAEVAGLSDQVTAKTSEIFVAAIHNQDTEVTRLGIELSGLVVRLYPAIERRDHAVESCRR